MKTTPDVKTFEDGSKIWEEVIIAIAFLPVLVTRDMRCVIIPVRMRGNS